MLEGTKRYAVLTLTLAIAAGCGSSTKTKGPATADTPKTGATDASSKTAPSKPAPPPRHAMNAGDNPTTRSGRGEPSLDDVFRLPAWVIIDEKGGRFIEKDDHPDVHWQIEGPVSATPSFRVEAYKPLLGDPRDFACTLYSESEIDGSKVAYAMEAKTGSFKTGQRYSLLRPGDDFILRNLTTGDVVTQIPSLLPGTYVIAAGVKNLQTGAEGLAISRFAVAE